MHLSWLCYQLARKLKFFLELLETPQNSTHAHPLFKSTVAFYNCLHILFFSKLMKMLYCRKARREPSGLTTQFQVFYLGARYRTVFAFSSLWPWHPRESIKGRKACLIVSGISSPSTRISRFCAHDEIWYWGLGEYGRRALSSLSG